MTGTSVGGSAHNPTIKITPRELTELRSKVDAVIGLCLDSMSARPNAAGIVDADTIWPTQVLDLLGVDYGPGSDLALRPYEEG